MYDLRTIQIHPQISKGNSFGVKAVKGVKGIRPRRSSKKKNIPDYKQEESLSQ